MDHKGNDVITTILAGSMLLGALGLITISLFTWIFS